MSTITIGVDLAKSVTHDDTDRRTRSPGAVYTLVRTGNIDATRPSTEMQSGNVMHRKHWLARRSTKDNTMTSESLKAQGESIKRAVLTGSLLQTNQIPPSSSICQRTRGRMRMNTEQREGQLTRIEREPRI